MRRAGDSDSWVFFNGFSLFLFSFFFATVFYLADDGIGTYTHARAHTHTHTDTDKRYTYTEIGAETERQRDRDER